jgi:hypothetical protein
MALVPVLMVSGFLVLIGLRLVRSGVRSDGAEFWLGAFFVAAASTLPLRLAIAMGVDVGVDPIFLNFVAQGVLYLGVLSFAAFTWKTFRPHGAVGRAGFSLVAILFVSNLVLMRTTGAYRDQAHAFHMVLSASLTVAFAWSFFETRIYHARMKRRAQLGLADPVVTNRFFLFSVWTGSMMIIPLAVTAIRVFNHVAGMEPALPEANGLEVRPGAEWSLAAIRALVSLFGPAMIVGLWLSFFPPARYLDWIRTRSGRRSAG